MKQLRRFTGFMRDRRVPLLSKLVFFAVAGGYALMPADFLPDILPLIGIADDGTVLLAAAGLFSRYAARAIEKAEDETERANEGKR